MIEDLIKLKKQIDSMIETYKDLHPDDEYITHEDETIIQEELEKEAALKKIREGRYESTFRKEQRKKTTKPSQGPPSLCVYGDA